MCQEFLSRREQLIKFAPNGEWGPIPRRGLRGIFWIRLLKVSSKVPYDPSKKIMSVFFFLFKIHYPKNQQRPEKLKLIVTLSRKKIFEEISLKNGIKNRMAPSEKLLMFNIFHTFES